MASAIPGQDEKNKKPQPKPQKPQQQVEPQKEKQQKLPEQQPEQQPVQEQQPLQEEQDAAPVPDDADVTPLPLGQAHASIERRVEYRDQDGNILDEEQVAALLKNADVSFETKYETRTKVIDEQGREIPEEVLHAPPHPDVEGQNPETVERKDAQLPVEQPPSSDGEEESLMKEQEKPKPASEDNEAATKQENDV